MRGCRLNCCGLAGGGQCYKDQALDTGVPVSVGEMVLMPWEIVWKMAMHLFKVLR